MAHFFPSVYLRGDGNKDGDDEFSIFTKVKWRLPSTYIKSDFLFFATILGHLTFFDGRGREDDISTTSSRCIVQLLFEDLSPTSLQ